MKSHRGIHFPPHITLSELLMLIRCRTPGSVPPPPDTPPASFIIHMLRILMFKLILIRMLKLLMQLREGMGSASQQKHPRFPKNNMIPGWQRLHGSTGGTCRKVWTRTKILSPNIRYFVANYALFLEIFGHKKCLFG